MLLISFFSFLSLLFPLLIAMAYLTLIESKVMAAKQRRKGPNNVGLFGSLQPMTDGLKLFIKETIIPSSSNMLLFKVSPKFVFLMAMFSWLLMPMTLNNSLIDLSVSIFFLLALSSLSVYGIMCAGWASNSKYAFLGTLRSTAQKMSYEISIGLMVSCILVCVGSTNLLDIVFYQNEFWFVWPLFPLFILFYISILAETNSAPFDLPEAEAELVAGYNTEYSAMGFALFFLGEYSNKILKCGFTTCLFIGGSYPGINLFIFFWMPFSSWFAIKTVILLLGFIWIRAALPRKRYDQLKYLGWKMKLPMALSFICFITSFLKFFNGLPLNM